jgi:hypothetical protein
MVRAVQGLKEGSNPKTMFFCLSNANSVYIETILQVRPSSPLPDREPYSELQSKGLEDLFDEIVTNPAQWEANGLLDLRRRVDPNGPQHGCKVGCSPNMCKGVRSSSVDILRLFRLHRLSADHTLYEFKTDLANQGRSSRRFLHAISRRLTA